MKLLLLFLTILLGTTAYSAKPFNRKGVPTFKGWKPPVSLDTPHTIECDPNFVLDTLTKIDNSLGKEKVSSPFEVKLSNDLEEIFIEKSMHTASLKEILNVIKNKLEEGVVLIDDHINEKKDFIYDLPFLKKLMNKSLKKLEEDLLHSDKFLSQELNEKSFAITIEKYFGSFKASLVELKYTVLEKNVIGSNIVLNRLKVKRPEVSKEILDISLGLEKVYSEFDYGFNLDTKLLRNLKSIYEVEAGRSGIPTLNTHSPKDFLDVIFIKEIDILTLDKIKNIETWVEVKNVIDIEIGSIKYERIMDQARKTVFLSSKILGPFGYPRKIQHKMIMNHPIPKKLKRELEWLGYVVEAPRVF